MTELPTCLYEPDGDLFHPTGLTRGPWDPASSTPARPPRCWRAPSSAPRGIAPGQVGRLGYDILRPVPLAPHRIETRTLRPGRNVEQIEAVAARRGERRRPDAPERVAAARARSSSCRPGSASSTLPHSPPAEGGISLPAFWTEPVAYHAALDWRFVDGDFDEPGPATAWTRLRVPLVAGEEPSPLERMLVMADAASGISHVLDWKAWVFINVDLGIHLERLPEGEWMAMDAVTRLGPTGAGLCTSVLSDERGRVGVSTQTLRVTKRGRIRHAVTLTGWIFMVGLRVFDIGALVVWLVWFFRQRDDEDDEGGGGAPAVPAAAAIPTAARRSPTPTRGPSGAATTSATGPRRPGRRARTSRPRPAPQRVRISGCINPTRFVGFASWPA